MRNLRHFLIGVLLLISTAIVVHGDIVVGTDGHLLDGKIVANNDKEVTIQADGDAKAEPRHIERAKVAQVLYTDAHGAVLAAPANAGAAPATRPAVQWDVPKEPAAPPAVTVAGASYYVVPLHGEVGVTVMSDALEKSLADAVTRKPTVVVLDIDSPGGSVAEAEKIIQIIHHYNKPLRLVALINQDLSAAAILSLSVKEIYVKPTSTIGAATSFIPGEPDLSAKVEEKMQSAWRAVARNSAEEGGHEPLLAEAMIDNTMELHLERYAGKPVVKEGPGAIKLCRKGQIMTLTSHEAVACGLSAGEADDYAALGHALKFANWSECKGLGTLLADYLPTRNAAFEAQAKKVMVDFLLNVQAAKTADPTQTNSYVVFQSSPQQHRGINRFGPPGMGQPAGPPVGPATPGGVTEVTQQTTLDTKNWKQRSLASVVALQKAEQNLQDVIALCDAFGQASTVGEINDSLTMISALRGKLYDDRNKYGSDTDTAAQAVVATGNPAPQPNPASPANPAPQPHLFWQPSAVPQPNPAPPPAAQPNPTPPPSPTAQPNPTPQPNPVAQPNPVLPPNPLRHRNPFAPRNPATLTEPSADETAAQLKKIDAGWKAATTQPVDLLATMTSARNIAKAADGSIVLNRFDSITTADSYRTPVAFRFVVLSDQTDLRIVYPADQIIFNWEMNRDQLRVDGGPAAGKHKDGAGRLPAGEWVGIELVVHADEMVIYVDGEERYRQKADFSGINRTFSINSHGGVTKIKSVTMVH